MDQARSLARDGGQALRERQEQDLGPNPWPLALQRYADRPEDGAAEAHRPRTSNAADRRAD
jgi:hypothetical protein